MAQEPPAGSPIPNTIFESVRTNAVTVSIMGRAEDHVARIREAHAHLDVLDDGYVDEARLVSLIVTYINGQEGLPEQRVAVEYLRQAQKLVIPAILGMDWATDRGGWCAVNPVLRTRYLKLGTKAFHELHAMVAAAATVRALRTAIDAIPEPGQMAAGIQKVVTWDQDAYYVDAQGAPIDKTTRVTVFTYISAAAQMNADVRDYGFLIDPANSKSDTAWKDADKCTENDLRIRLKPYTMQSIAALNLPRVAGSAVAAWVRAHGLGVGILPDRASLSAIEYSFDVSMPRREDVTTVSTWQTSYEGNAPELCCNIIAMFGLFHLNKDHTHRSNDAAMERIQKSYINAIRTCTRADMVDYMLAHKEEITRTGPHPFGLAQTYWLALAMGHLSKIASPLALRLDTCPPPVQRLLMVNAVVHEWSSLPAGQMLNKAYAEELRVISEAVLEVRASPPSYSGLCRLYGINAQSELSEKVRNAVAAVIPPIFGYVECTHVNADNERFGPALALSWQNIKREHNAILLGWQSMWDKYFQGMDVQGMDEFVRQTKASLEEARSAGQ